MFILPLLLKDSFAGYWILGWHFFPLSAFQICHPLLVSIFLIINQLILLKFSSSWWVIVYLLAFLRFSVWVWQFGCYMFDDSLSLYFLNSSNMISFSFLDVFIIVAWKCLLRFISDIFYWLLFFLFMKHFCFFACLLFFCWKLDIVDNIATVDSDPHSPPASERLFRYCVWTSWVIETSAIYWECLCGLGHSKFRQVCSGFYFLLM